MRLMAEAAFAPYSPTRRGVIRSEFRTVDNGTPVFEAFEKWGPGSRQAPFLFDHEDERIIGRIVNLTADPASHHWVADIVVDVPDTDPELCAEVRRRVKAGAAVSPKFEILEIDETPDPTGTGLNWYRLGHLDHLALVDGDGDVAGYRQARIHRVSELGEKPKSKPKTAAARATVELEPADGLTFSGGDTLIRRGLGTILELR
jgi:hypothetical protein